MCDKTRNYSKNKYSVWAFVRQKEKEKEVGKMVQRAAERER
jgi:hypothetical protein